MKVYSLLLWLQKEGRDLVKWKKNEQEDRMVSIPLLNPWTVERGGIQKEAERTVPRRDPEIQGISSALKSSPQSITEQRRGWLL